MGAASRGRGKLKRNRSPIPVLHKKQQPENSADTATIPVQVTQPPLGSTITLLSAPQNPTQPVRNASPDEAVDGFLVMVAEERVVVDPSDQTQNKQVRLMLIV